MKTFLVCISMACLVMGCEPEIKEVPAAAVTLNAEGFELSDLEGTAVKLAFKKDADGNIIERGYLRDGKKNGAWLVYQDDFRFPKTMINYTDGIANGVYMEFNERGDVTVQAFYKNNKLDGIRGEYKFGRPLTEAEYKADKLHGFFREYNMRDGKLRKEVYYENGVQNGPFRTFNGEEQMTLEYIYKDGERVSGGIIETDKENTPK